MLLALEIILFTYCLWLGCYLLGRNLADWRLRYAGLGLVAYAAALAGMILAPEASFSQPLLYLPPIFWLGAIVALYPLEEPSKLSPLLDYMLPLVAIIVYLLGWGAQLLGRGQWFVANFVILALLLSGVTAVWLWRHTAQLSQTEKQVRRWTLIVTLFFALGSGGLVLPLSLPWLPPIWIVLALSLDLEILGFLIIWLDAYEQGESMRRDVIRSAVYSFATVLFFGGQVVWAMSRQGSSPHLWLLLLSVITTAVLSQTFGDQFSFLLDRLVFMNSPQQQEARAQLRAAETAVARQSSVDEAATFTEKDFHRLTRKALSQMGNLPKLASSPLTQIPPVTQKLQQTSQQDIGGETLARAAILRQLLVESIGRLRPSGTFSTTDEWRFYNAVYFPYVAGLKPYSRRMSLDGLTAEEQEALTWFQHQVPERTLYNWQKKAAELIARDLQEQF